MLANLIFMRQYLALESKEYKADRKDLTALFILQVESRLSSIPSGFPTKMLSRLLKTAIRCAIDDSESEANRSGWDFSNTLPDGVILRG